MPRAPLDGSIFSRAELEPSRELVLDFDELEPRFMAFLRSAVQAFFFGDAEFCLGDGFLGEGVEPDVDLLALPDALVIPSDWMQSRICSEESCSAIHLRSSSRGIFLKFSNVQFAFWDIWW